MKFFVSDFFLRAVSYICMMRAALRCHTLKAYNKLVYQKGRLQMNEDERELIQTMCEQAANNPMQLAKLLFDFILVNQINGERIIEMQKQIAELKRK